jgi:hypothetical protein
MELDPFSYFADVASKIRPFGGSGQQPDLSYGFHTHYVRCAPGYCTFSLEVDGLAATTGVLHLQVHMLSAEPGAHAKVATIERLELARLADTGGRAAVRFESLRGMTYAVFGRISGYTDAAASSLRVYLDRPGSETDDILPEQAAPTGLGKRGARPSDQLTSIESPSFATPVSQICTPSQIQETAFARSCAAIGKSPAPSVSLWESCFVLQVLDRYGLIARGSEGLGLADLDNPIIPVLIARGCRLVLGEHGAAPLTPDEWLEDRWQELARYTDLPPDEKQRIKIAQTYMPAPQDNLGLFDFLWSRSLATMMDLTTAHGMVVNSMTRIRPGGIAIHMLKMRIPSNDTSDGAGAIGFTRDDIQRLALDIVSQGHIVAQLKFARGIGLKDPDIPAGTTGFGLVLRRG